MWNRLQHLSWIFVALLFLVSGTGIAHAAQTPAHTSSRAATPGDDFSKFAGTWIAHGAFMIVSSDGRARFEARTYDWCAPNIAQPCDSMRNDQIVYGHHERLALSSTSDSTAYGTVISSNYRPNVHTTVTLTLGPDDTLAYVNNGSLVLLCGPQAPAGTCGA